MSRFYFIMLCLYSSTALAQFVDNFTDSNFTHNPMWSGDTSNFEISSEELHLNAPTKSDTSCLQTNSFVTIDAVWNFEVTLDFNPSSSNYCRIYLTSSNTDLKNTTSGYYVMIGGTTDEISLYRQDDDKVIKIIDGIDNKTDLTHGRYRIKVSRDSTFLWTLSSDTGINNQYQIEGSIVDSTYKSSNSFGIFCKYTSTRSNKFYFDNFKVDGQTFIDTDKPKVANHSIISDRVWQIRFNEAIQVDIIGSVNFMVNSSQLLSNMNYDSITNTLNLHFNTAFQHGKLMTLSIKNISDLNNNYLSETTLKDVFIKSDSILHKNLIFNELMIDPEPAIALPEIEYIEIFNRSNQFIKLDNFYLLDSKDSIYLPHHILNPKDYLIIADQKDSVKWKSSYQNIVFITSLSLSNSGEVLILKTRENKTIDSINYLPTLFDSEKKDGGWSLELIDPNFNCSGSENWTASIDPSGGTPGRKNSVYSIEQPIESLEIEKLIELGDGSLTFKLNREFDERTMSITSLIINPFIKIDSFFVQFNELTILFSESFKKNHLYTLTISSLNDCYNRPTQNLSIEFPIPAEISRNDVIINEVLFNPYPGEKDFIELFNNSNKYIDVSQLILGKIENGFLTDSFLVSHLLYILLPYEYLTLSEDSFSVLSTYSCASVSFIINSTIPSLSDKNGHIGLYSLQGFKIDELSYSEEMHFTALEEVEGISLERINPNSASDNKSNWTSAAFTCSYATPGIQNSQYLNELGTKFEISPAIFSPDNDGYHDICQISITSQPVGNLASISIYNDKGYLIRSLVDAITIGSNEAFYWDGTDRFSEKVPIGYYLVILKIINDYGDSNIFKSTVVVANRK